MKLCELIFDDECKIKKEDKNLEITHIATSLDDTNQNSLFFIFNERALKDFINKKTKNGVVVLDEKLNFASKNLGRTSIYLLLRISDLQI